MRLRTNSPAVLQMLMITTMLLMMMTPILISRLLIIAAVYQSTTCLQNSDLSPANCQQHHFTEVCRVSTEFTSPQLWSTSISSSSNNSSCSSSLATRHRRYYSQPVRNRLFSNHLSLWRKRVCRLRNKDYLLFTLMLQWIFKSNQIYFKKTNCLKASYKLLKTCNKHKSNKRCMYTLFTKNKTTIVFAVVDHCLIILVEIALLREVNLSYHGQIWAKSSFFFVCFFYSVDNDWEIPRAMHSAGDELIYISTHLPST